MITQNNCPYRVSYLRNEQGTYSGNVEFYMGTSSPISQTIYCKIFDANGVQIGFLQIPGSATGWPSTSLPGDYIRAEFYRSNSNDPDWIIQINCPNGAATDLSGVSITFNFLPAIQNYYLLGVNHALELDGESSYVQSTGVTGFENFGQDEFTLQGWIRTTQPGCLVSLINTASSQSVLSLCIEEKGSLALYIGGTRYGTNFGSSLLDEEWHFVNAVVAMEMLDLYIDSVLQTRIPLNNLPEPNTITEILIGKGLAPGGSISNTDTFNDLPLLGQFTGQIATVGIYNTIDTPSPSEMVLRGYLLEYYPSAAAYWDFTTGTYNDQSGNGNNGTGVDASFESMDIEIGQQEYALTVRGFENGVSMAQASDSYAFDFGPGPFTLEAWVRTTQGGAILSCGAQASGTSGLLTPGYRFWLDREGNIYILTADGFNLNPVIVSTTEGTEASDGSWHHVAVTRDGSGNWVLYLDGKPIVSRHITNNFDLRPGAASVWLGYSEVPADLAPPPPVGDGGVPETIQLPEISLKEVRVWGTALSQPDIFRLMFQHIDPYMLSGTMDIRGYWSFQTGNPVDIWVRSSYELSIQGAEVEPISSLLLSTPQYAMQGYGAAPYITQYPFGNGEWTVEAWVNNKSTSPTFGLFLSPLTSNPNMCVAAGADYNNVFKVYNLPFNDTTNSYSVLQFQTSNLADGEWHHIALVCTAQDFRLYIDGLSAPAIAAIEEGHDVHTTTEFQLGGSQQTMFNNSRNVWMTEFRVWRKARSQGEIQATMRQMLSGTEDDLVGYWDFSTSSGLDMTSMENNLTQAALSIVNDTTIPVALPEGALWFDGSTGYGDLGTPADLNFSGTRPYTIAGWVKQSMVGNERHIFSKHNFGVSGQYYMALAQGKLVGARNVNPWTITGITEFEDNAWYHVAMTFDGQSLAVYVNGNMETSGNFSSVGGDNTGVLIGAALSNNVPADFFAGEISELTIWNTCLDSTDIWGLANRQLGNLIPIPTAYWNFRTGSIVDQTGNGNNFTLHGGTALVPSDFNFNEFSDVLCFTGSNQFVDCGSAAGLHITGSLSMEMWMKVERWSESWETVFGFNSGYRIRRNNTTTGLTFSTEGISSLELSSNFDVADGNWHHVAVVLDADGGPGQIAKYLYIDGVLQAQQTGLSGSVSYAETTSFGIGGNQSDPGFQGWITEARVWSKALSLEDDILPHLDRKVVGNEPDLAGYWKCTTVDDTEVDLSTHGNNGTYRNGMQSDIAPFRLLPPLPFIVAKSKMIQDWTTEHVETNDTQGRTVYQTVITVYSANGNPMPGEELQVWCNEPNDIQVGGTYYSVDDGSAATLYTDATGKLTISTVAGALSTPSLNIWAPFMKSDDRIIICPDDNVLDGLSDVQGDMLQQGRNSQPPLLDPSYFSPEEADDLAEAVRNSVATVKSDGSTEELRRTPRYRGRTITSGERSAPDVSSFPYSVTDGQPFTRPVTPAASAENWALSFTSNSIWVPDGGTAKNISFRTLSADEIREKLTREGKPLKTPEIFSVSSAWHKFTRAVDHFEAVVVTTAETLYHEAENTVVVILQEVGQSIEEAAQVIVDDIRQVGQFVVGTLAQAITAVGEVIEDVAIKVVAFFRDEFGWEDILMTKNAIATALNQFPPAMEQIADDFVALMGHVFASLEGLTEEVFDLLIDQLGTMSIRSATTAPDYRSVLPSDPRAGSGAGSDGGEPQPNVSNLFNEFAVEANYLLSKLFDADDDGIRSADFGDFGEGIVDPILEYLGTIINQIANSDAVQAFESAYDYFSQILSNPESFLQLLLEGLLRVVEGIALAAMEILQLGLELLAQIVKLFIQAFQNLWNAPLEIPVISWLYTNVITYDTTTGQGSQLTILDFFSLLLAIPTTLIYKQLFDEAPISSEILAELESSGYALPPVPPAGQEAEFFGIPTREQMQEIYREINEVGGLQALLKGGLGSIPQMPSAAKSPSATLQLNEEEDGGNNIFMIDWKLTLFWTIAYDITYLAWAPVDIILDLQRVVVPAPFGGTTSYGAGGTGKLGKYTSGIDFSNRPGIQKVLAGFSYMFPINFQALSFPPAGPGSRYIDYGLTTAAQRADFAFWLYKGLGILANLVANMIGSKQVSSRTEKAFTGFADQLGEEMLEDGEIGRTMALLGVLGSTETVDALARRFTPWMNTLFGGGWIIFAAVVCCMDFAALIRAWKNDEIPSELLPLAEGDFFLKSLQNLVEGLSPFGKFLGTTATVDSTEGLSLAVLAVLDLTSDVGSGTIGGFRSMIMGLTVKKANEIAEGEEN